MDELFFGVKRKKTRSSPHRRRSSPHRRRSSPHRRRSSPHRRRSSPHRRTTMCRKKLSLPKLRKLALEHNINIFSEAKTAINKRTGMPKKPKLVGCSTLMKRLDEAGLSNLYKTRSVSVDMDMPGDLFMESPMLGMPEMQEMPDEDMPSMPSMPSMPAMPAIQEQSLLDPDCNVYWSNWSKANANEAKKFRGVMKGDGDCATRVKNRKLVPEIQEIPVIDPDCNVYWSNWSYANPRKAKGFKGVMKGDGDCATRVKNRKLVPDDEEEADPDALAEAAGFDMGYGRHYSASARPRKTVKHVGSIVVKGRTHHVFKGSEGGLFYLKGKTGAKVYITKERLRRR